MAVEQHGPGEPLPPEQEPLDITGGPGRPGVFLAQVMLGVARN